MSAFPGGENRYSAYGNLLFIPNALGDRIENLEAMIPIQTPGGRSDTEFINELINAADAYGRNTPAPYHPISSSDAVIHTAPHGPGNLPRVTTYNSNSFVSGVFQAVGLSRPSLFRQGIDFFGPILPLYNHPLPIHVSGNSAESRGYTQYADCICQ